MQTLIASYLVPKVWDYFQSNIINVASATYGSQCYEVDKSKNVKNYTQQLLASSSSTPAYQCPAINIPVTLLVELFLICSVRRIVIQSDLYVPQHILVQVSETGLQNTFKTVKVIRSAMQKQIPFEIELMSPYPNVKYIRFVVQKGRVKHVKDRIESGSFSLRYIHVYGTPVLTPQNLAHLQSMEAFASVFQKAKQNIQYLTGIPLTSSNTSNPHPSSESEVDDHAATDSDQEEELQSQTQNTTNNKNTKSSHNSTNNTTSTLIFEEIEEEEPVTEIFGSVAHSEKISTASRRSKLKAAKEMQKPILLSKL